MRVLFVNPPRCGGLPVIREDRCEIVNRYLVSPPYSLIQIASVLRGRGHDVQVIDANCEDLTCSEVRERMAEGQPDAVAFRFTPTTIVADMETANIAKSLHPDAPTIGICWTLKRFAEQIIRDHPNLDVYARGEYGSYESIFLELVESIDHGSSLKTVSGISFRNDDVVVSTADRSDGYLTDPPIPAYDLLPPLSRYHISPKHSKHSPFTIMYTSMGCPYGCTFCVIRKTKWRARSVENVMREITHLKDEHGLRCVFFMDETFTMERQRTLELCEALMDDSVDLRWYTSTRVDKVDREMLELMRGAGCRAISFGIESGSQEILDNAKKGVTVQQSMEAIDLVKEAGMGVHLSFIVGLPGENQETLKETNRFVSEALPTMAQFNVAVPYPGTPLYDLAVSNGWIEKELDYTQLQHQVSIMRTGEMTMEEIEEARKRAYRSLYFNPRWLLSQLSNLEDISLTVRHYLKSLGMYLLHGMKHSH